MPSAKFATTCDKVIARQLLRMAVREPSTKSDPRSNAATNARTSRGSLAPSAAKKT
jgi:hypothetical protein